MHPIRQDISFMLMSDGASHRTSGEILTGKARIPTILSFSATIQCYEVLEWFEGSDGLTIVDQIDPGRVEKEIVLEEMDRWPGWATQAPVLHPPHYERIEAEWELASVVMVNSEWSKQALVQQGVAASKIEIIPIAYDPPDDADEVPQVSSKDEPFRLLWLGSVILRKGIPYLLGAAKRLKTSSVQIDVVGPVGITDKAIQEAPSNVTFHGRVPRDSVDDWYGRADAFVLPTLSDGFAITQLEAMAHGLPVIATPHCGQVVKDGETGLIVPVRDVNALAQAIDELSADRSKTHAMGRAARDSLNMYDPSRVSDQILAMARKRLTPA
jgi:glycosyltransferase involved in cell wall biosynthesis